MIIPIRYWVALALGLGRLLCGGAACAQTALSAAAASPSSALPSTRSPLPPERADEEVRLGGLSLMDDVARLVEQQEMAGWFIDSAAYERTVDALLESVCHASPEHRTQALVTLRNTVQHGRARELYVRAGRHMTSKASAALSAERRLIVLERAVARADECPFFVEPSRRFRGLQTESYKWALHFEGGGLGQIRRSGGAFTLGGGGAGRLLVGRGFRQLSLLAGVEGGGSVGLQSTGAGGQLPLSYNVALPFVLRIRGNAWLYDAEVAPLAALDNSFAVAWGGRFGLGVGIAGPRTRGFLPWAGVFATADQYFPRDGGATAQVLRAGVRVGIRWLP